MEKSDIDINKIQPIIPSNIYKILKEEINGIITKISKENGLNSQDILQKYDKDISKIGVEIGIKKRNRRILPDEIRCMGRKIDGKQCTRSKRADSEFCLSHIKRLPHGRIDDDTYQAKVKGKRGRKKKICNFNNDEYIATRLEIINGTQYLVDSNNNVYSYNIESPTFIGLKKDVENTTSSTNNEAICT